MAIFVTLDPEAISKDEERSCYLFATSLYQWTPRRIMSLKTQRKEI